jgi:phosphoglycerate dehydrogenase-like enzyme
LEHLPEAEFLISERAGVIDAEIIDAAKHLRLIQRLGSLTYDIDLEAAQAAGVPVSARPVEGSIMVAEHVVMQMLALAKRLGEVKAVAEEARDWGQPSRRTDENVFAYDWSGRKEIAAVYGRTVGILGFGEIGAELSRRLQGFAPARIVYHKRRRLPTEAEADLGIVYAPLAQVAMESDSLCNLLPYSPSTDMLLNAAFLAAMKPGAFLVSCGSGSVIDEAALAEALEAGHLAGAALDTFEWEPIRPENPLLPLARDPSKNVLLTPHTAAGRGMPEAGSAVRQADYENIVRLLDGQTLLYRVV